MSISGFRFLGSQHSARLWKDLLTSVAKIMLELHESEFDKVLALRGTKRQYFSRNQNELREPVKIGDSSIYAETHFSARMIVERSRKLIALFGYAPEELEIEVT